VLPSPLSFVQSPLEFLHGRLSDTVLNLDVARLRHLHVGMAQNPLYANIRHSERMQIRRKVASKSVEATPWNIRLFQRGPNDSAFLHVVASRLLACLRDFYFPKNGLTMPAS
jgi:hypothetical protein